MAVGIGFYGEFNRGYEYYGGNLGGDLKGSNDYTGGNGGIIIDTSAAKDSMFNYRFRLGGGKTPSGKTPTRYRHGAHLRRVAGEASGGTRSASGSARASVSATFSRR